MKVFIKRFFSLLAISYFLLPIFHPLVLSSTEQALYVLSFLQVSTLTFWALTDAINICPLIYHSLLKIEKFINARNSEINIFNKERESMLISACHYRFFFFNFIETLSFNPPENILISMSAASFCYEQNNKRILEELNLIVQRYEVLAIVGSVGSGKSSVAMAILGLLRRQKGEFTVQGSIAYAPQQVLLFLDLLDSIFIFQYLTYRHGLLILLFEKIFYLGLNSMNAG